MLTVARSISEEAAPIYTVTAHEFEGNGETIGSTISGAIVSSRSWSTANKATSVALLQVVDNWPHTQWAWILLWGTPRPPGGTPRLCTPLWGHVWVRRRSHPDTTVSSRDRGVPIWGSPLLLCATFNYLNCSLRIWCRQWNIKSTLWYILTVSSNLCSLEY